MMKTGWICVALCLAGTAAMAQENSSEQQQPDRAKSHTSAKRDVGSGSADIGKGAGKGAADIAKGTGKAAGDLVTLHPIDAAADAGKGAAGAGKNAGIGAVKGTGKIIRGTGKALRHLF
jgi:hypothetical protein